MKSSEVALFSGDKPMQENFAALRCCRSQSFGSSLQQGYLPKPFYPRTL